MYIETTEKLLDFIKKSPTAFQAVDEMQKRLTENGFEVLSEKKYWKLLNEFQIQVYQESVEAGPFENYQKAWEYYTGEL